MGKTLFAEEPDSGYRLLFAVLCAALILFIDVRFGWLKPVRNALSIVTETVVTVTDLPRRAFVGLDEAITTRSTLTAENARLMQENLVLQRHVQRLAALTAENSRLRELLNSSALLDSNVLVAEIIGVDPDPSRVEVIIDKGAADRLYVGQPVLDASGIIGQLIAVGPSQSRVILITDHRHGLPVEINRNGVRSIAIGTGKPGLLQLQYLAATTDIRVGDLLVSSGLGGVFPRGYPVGRVSRVEREPRETFMRVDALPTAAIERSRHVLLVFAQQLQATLMQQVETMPVSPQSAAPAPVGSGAHP